MLQFIRERAQGILAWIIVVLIIVPFALWGIQEYLGGGKEIPVAEVDGAGISKERLQSAYQQQRQRLQDMLGSNFRPEMFAEAPMKQAVLDSLIERELLSQSASEAGMRVSDEALGEVIRSIPAFQAGGQFSQDLYLKLLSAQGMTPQRFETELRRDLLIGQLRSGIELTAFVTPNKTESHLRLQSQKRDFGYALFAVDKYLDKVQVGDEEIAGFYEANKERFKDPEKIRIAYIELSSNHLAGMVSIGEEEVQAYYNGHTEEFREPEERRASHILVRVEQGAAQEADKAARDKAEAALKRLQAGASFADLSKEISEDPGSAGQGGDLGFFGRGMMVKAFEEAVFGLKKGEVTGPVRSEFGYHIIRLDDLRGGDVKPYAAARHEVQKQLREEKAQERFYDLAERLSNLAYEHPESLQPAAEQLGLAIRHSDYFSRKGGAGIATNPKVVEAAFGEQALEQGNNSDTIELSPTDLVVLRVEDRRPEAQRPLEDVSNAIAGQLRREKARKAAREAVDQLFAEFKGGAEPTDLVKRANGQWKRETGVSRGTGEVLQPIVGTVFGMPRPVAGPTFARTSLPNGDEAIVVLYGVEEATVATDNVPPNSGALERAGAEAEYAGFIATLRGSAEVEIHADQM